MTENKRVKGKKYMRKGKGIKVGEKTGEKQWKKAGKRGKGKKGERFQCNLTSID